MHVAVDDCSRYACAEALPDERGPTTAGFLGRAVDRFGRPRRPGRAGAHRQRRELPGAAFRETAAEPRSGAAADATYWPQTDGKAEASAKILQAEWAYRRRYASNGERLADLLVFLREYDHDRPHGGSGGAVPASRL